MYHHFKKNIYRNLLCKCSIHMSSVFWVSNSMALELTKPFCVNWIFLLDSFIHHRYPPCVIAMNWIINGSSHGVSILRRQSITYPGADLLSVETFGTNLSEILFKTLNFSLKKSHLKMSSVKYRPFCSGLRHHWVGVWQYWTNFDDIPREWQPLISLWRAQW